MTAANAVRRETLDNGLLVLVEERRSANTVAVHLVARTGTRDDAPERAGEAMLTSRLVFQGTPRRPSESDVQRAAAQVGGSVARGTDAELSALSSVVSSAEVEVAFDLLSDLATEPLLAEDALARQKQIALQDLARRRADPNSLIADLFQQAMFEGHPLSTPPLGTGETITALSRSDVVANRERFWGAANLVMVVVGRLTSDQALHLAERTFARIPPGAREPRQPAPPAVPGAARSVRGNAGQQQAQFRLAFPGPSLLDADRYPLTVLNALMSGASGRLFQEVRTSRALAYSAGSGYAGFTDAGAWFATAGVDPKNLDAALEVVQAEVQRLRDETPEEGEVASRISQIAGREILADETNAARAGRLASQEVLGLVSTEEFVRRVRQVTPEDVQRVARRYLEPDRSMLVVVTPAA